MAPRNPFMFLDPYGPDERDLFFGREREISDLYTQLYQSRLLLICGESGCGKTSLISCGLQSEISADKATFIFVRTATDPLAALRDAVLKCTEFDDDEPPTESLELLEEASFYHSTTLVLVFDQLEEIFTVLTDAHRREQFFVTVAEWLGSGIDLRIVLSIREEYLARLSEFEAQLPTLFENRFWVRKMSGDQAREVIVRPCHRCGIDVEDDLVHRLTQDLAREGGTVELPILQVVLDSLYHRSLTDDASARPTLKLSSYKDLGEVESILGTFIEQRIKVHPDPDLVRQVLKAMITPEGTKRLSSKEEIRAHSSTYGETIAAEKLDALVDHLIDDRILRVDSHTRLYELRHDALATTVFAWMTGLEKELAERRAALEIRLKEYRRSKRMLSQEFLTELAPYLHRLQPSDEAAALIAASHQRVESRARKRRRVLTAIAAGLMLVITAFAGFALVKWREADEQTRRYKKENAEHRATSLKLRTALAEADALSAVLTKKTFMKDARTFINTVSNIEKLIKSTNDARFYQSLFNIYQRSQAVQGGVDRELGTAIRPLIKALINKSQSMRPGERKYWHDTLPIMTSEQRSNLISILLNEQRQITAAEEEYQQPIEIERMSQLKQPDWPRIIKDIYALRAENEMYSDKEWQKWIRHYMKNKRVSKSIIDHIKGQPDQYEGHFIIGYYYFIVRRFPEAKVHLNKFVSASAPGIKASLHRYRTEADPKKKERIHHRVMNTAIWAEVRLADIDVLEKQYESAFRRFKSVVGKVAAFTADNEKYALVWHWHAVGWLIGCLERGTDRRLIAKYAKVRSNIAWTRFAAGYLSASKMGGRLGSLSWHQLFAGQYDDAVLSAKVGIALAPSEMFIYGNLAHGYLLGGQYEKARKIYLEHVGKKIDTETWTSVAIQDFKALRKAGINNEHMDSLAAQMKQKADRRQARIAADQRRAEAKKSAAIAAAVGRPPGVSKPEVDPPGKGHIGNNPAQQELFARQIEKEVHKKHVPHEAFQP